MKNEKERPDEKQVELVEPELEQADGGLIINSPLLKDRLADPRPSPIFELEL